MVSASPTASRIIICVKQEGNILQHNLVAGVGTGEFTLDIFKHSTMLEESFFFDDD